MSLTNAMNSRKTGRDKVVPIEEITTENVLILETAPTVPEGRPAREVAMIQEPKPGQLGAKTLDAWPDVEYSLEATRGLLNRTLKGTQFMMEHLMDSQGQEALGLYCELLEATQCMMIAHTANGIFGRDNGSDGK